MKAQHFYTKLLCQKPILRQTEWGGTITKNGVFPVTTLFFRIFCFNLRTSYKKLLWCANHPNIHIHTFRERWSFTLGCFCPVNILMAICESGYNWQMVGDKLSSTNRMFWVTIFNWANGTFWSIISLTLSCIML